MVRVGDEFEHPQKCPIFDQIEAGESLVRSSSFKISQRKPKSKPKRATSMVGTKVLTKKSLSKINQKPPETDFPDYAVFSDHNKEPDEVVSFSLSKVKQESPKAAGWKTQKYDLLSVKEEVKEPQTYQSIMHKGNVTDFSPSKNKQNPRSKILTKYDKI